MRQRILAIMFADIVRSSEIKADILKKQISDFVEERASEFRSDDNVIFVKTMGDGIVVLSDSCGDLAESALNFSDKFKNFDWIKKGFPHPLQVRVALDLQPLFLKDKGDEITDFFGSGADTAASLEPLVEPNHVYCSESYFSLLNSQGPNNIGFTEIGQGVLKHGGLSPNLLCIEWIDKTHHSFKRKTHEKRLLVFDNTLNMTPAAADTPSQFYDLFYTIGEWQEKSFDEFKEIIFGPRYLTLLKYVERRVKSDLIRILADSMLVNEVFFSTRIKSPLSAYDKLKKVDPTNEKYKHLNFATKYYPHQILEDLVGARIICIDTLALFEFVQELARTGNIEIDRDCEFYEFIGAKGLKKEFGYMKNLIERWIRGTVKTKSKQSGYESIHFTVKFNATRDVFSGSYYNLGPVYNERVKLVNRLREQMDDETSSLIPTFPIELQVRLFTSHIWARDEHKYQYVHNKKQLQIGPESNDDDIQIKNHFDKMLKQLRAVELTRRNIRKGYSTRTRNIMAFCGKSFEAESRSFFFEKWDLECQQLIIIERLLADISLGHDKGLETYKRIDNTCLDIKAKHNEDYFKECQKNNLVPFWGRQRLLLMMLGYVLLFSEDSTLKRVIKRMSERDGLRKIFGGSLEVAMGKIAAARCYEFILEMDEVVRREVLKNFDVYGDSEWVFYDPLVYSRLASAYYLDDDFKRAEGVMGKLFLESWWPKFDWENTKLGLPKVYQFHMRRAQYLWNMMGFKKELVFRFSDEVRNELRLMLELGGNLDVRSVSWAVVISKFMSDFLSDGKEFEDILSSSSHTLKYLVDVQKAEHKWYYHFAKGITCLLENDQDGAISNFDYATGKLDSGIRHPKNAAENYYRIIEFVRAGTSP